MNLVSICIPCHNSARYVGAALDSVLSQTWKSLEVIVVNDGSTDKSEEVLYEYRNRGVKVIQGEYGSASKARNRALKEATGDYIKFFDADDLLSPEMIEAQMLRLEGNQDSVASSEWGRFYGDEISNFTPNPQSVWRDMAAADWLVEAWADARPMTQPGMFLIPREVLDAAGGWDESLTLIDDFEFFARIFCHSKQLLFTLGSKLYYRSGIDNSLSTRRSRDAVESAYHSVVRGTGHLLGRRNDGAAKRSCANVLQDFIYTYYPDHADLREKIEELILGLGGSDLRPDGSPKFQAISKMVGWKVAKRVQALTTRISFPGGK